MEKLAVSLPLNLIAVLLSSDTGTRLAHLLRGVRLLHVLCDAASRHNRLEQVSFSPNLLFHVGIRFIFYLKG